MSNHKIGDRVRIKIALRSDWTDASVDALDGETGTIEKGYHTTLNTYLVRLDRERCWPGSGPVTAFHFQGEDLHGVNIDACTCHPRPEAENESYSGENFDLAQHRAQKRCRDHSHTHAGYCNESFNAVESKR